MCPARIWSTRTSTTSPPSSGNRPTERVLDLPPSGPVELAYAAVYPNRHGVGAANLGFQTVVGMLASAPGASCHRAFADFPLTLEAGRPLADYHVVALSLSFEGDYPEALHLLGRGGVPLRSAERDAGAPLVIAGGVGPSLNPEPLAPFLDAVLLGEAETGLAGLHDFLRAHRRLSRLDLLAALADAGLPGVYVPSRYAVEEEEGIVTARRPLGSAPPQVDRLWAAPPWPPAHTRVWSPGDAFGGAFLLEVSRGCPHACRFCAAGHLTRPARFLDLETLAPLARFGASEVGRVGLVGAAVSDHPDLEALGFLLLDQGAGFTVSSFRAENLDPGRLDLLMKGGLQTLTVALEAGTDRLRRLLGKEVTEGDLLAAARMAGEAGLHSLRIYGMVGLPGEEDEDARALVEIAGEAREALGGGSVTVSVAPFVPKPHTPLQWEPMAPESVLRGRIRLMQRLAGPRKGVRVVAEAPKWARVQGLLSRGGRSVAPLLEAAARTGDWRAALRSPLAGRMLDRERDLSEALPWDFIGATPGRPHLLREREAALRRAAPLPCEPGSCRACGIC